jgi:hypothetical protein
MTTPRYVRKYRASAAVSDPEELFGDFLEQLDLTDWAAMLEDLLIVESADIYEIIAPAPGIGLLEYAASLFEQASPASLRHLGLATERILARTRKSYEDPRGREVALNCLRLLEMLEDMAPVDGVVELATNSDVPPEIRLEAALLFCNRPNVHINWRDLSQDESYLLPAVISGLSAGNPVDAIHALVATSHAPPNIDMIEYPMRITVRRLIRDEGISRAVELLDSVPHRHWGRQFIFQRTLRAAEFIHLKDRVDAYSDRFASEESRVDEVSAERAAYLAHTAAAVENIWQNETADSLTEQINDTSVFVRFRRFAEATLARAGVS